MGCRQDKDLAMETGKTNTQPNSTFLVRFGTDTEVHPRYGAGTPLDSSTGHADRQLFYLGLVALAIL